VPNSSDVVCIDQPGQYTVTVTKGVAGLVYIGNGSASVEVILAGQRSGQGLAASMIVVRRLGALRPLASAQLNTGTLDVEGTLRIEGGVLDLAKLVVGDSAFLFANRDVHIVGLYRLTAAGDIYLNDTLTIELANGGDASFDSTGQVSGVNGLLIITPVSGARATVIWNGSMLYESPATQRGLLVARGTDVDVAYGRYGTLRVDPGSDSVEVKGEVGAQATLIVEKSQGAGETDVGMRRVRNLGRMQLTTAAAPMRVRGSIVNEGDLVLGHGDIELQVDSLHNANELTIADSATLTNGILRNRGIIEFNGSSAKLVIAGPASFLADSGGTVAGTIIAGPGGIIGGDGSVRRVISVGGTISPGEPRYPKELGLLALDTLVLDSASRTILELKGSYGFSDEYDRIDVARHLALGGTLEARKLIYYWGASCGDIVRPITWHTSAVRVGAFHSAPTLAIDAHRAYRVHMAPNAVELLGHDPTVRLSFADSTVRTDERKSSTDSTLACLSGPAPLADVIATGVSPFGQSLILDTLRFTPADWAYAKSISIQAVDDSLVEWSGHHDSIRFDLTSTDPAYSGGPTQTLLNLISDNELGPDLEIAHVGGPVVVSLGQQFEGAFEVTNYGSGNSSGSTLSFSPLQGLEYVSNGSGASCTAWLYFLYCRIDPVPDGGSLRFTILFRATTVGVHANVGWLVTAERDPTSLNHMTYTVTVN
jgi:hypothetical protein